jgi:hypothetical protein
MKTAGDVLSALFDERFVKKAHNYSKFFDSWKDITAKNGIPAAADHSRIKDLDRGIILLETDHPGWKQILQIKQSKLLNDFCRRFPELDISGISLMLGNNKTAQETEQTFEEMTDTQNNGTPDKPDQDPITTTSLYTKDKSTESVINVFDSIKDEDFKKLLKSVEQNIAARNNN